MHAMLKEMLRLTRSQELRSSTSFSSTSASFTSSSCQTKAVIRSAHATVPVRWIDLNQLLWSLQLLQLSTSLGNPKITALGNVTLQDMIIKWYEFELYRAVKILLPPVPIAQSNTVTTFLARYVLTDSHKNFAHRSSSHFISQFLKLSR
jgi:hypothetical protein